jgi:hypothetical protein
MLPSQKIKMAAYYAKKKKCFRRHLGLSRHFDFFAWKQFFVIYQYNISNNENISLSGCAIIKSFLKNIIFHIIPPF